MAHGTGERQGVSVRGVGIKEGRRCEHCPWPCCEWRMAWQEFPRCRDQGGEAADIVRDSAPAGRAAPGCFGSPPAVAPAPAALGHPTASSRPGSSRRYLCLSRPAAQAWAPVSPEKPVQGARGGRQGCCLTTPLVPTTMTLSSMARAAAEKHNSFLFSHVGPSSARARPQKSLRSRRDNRTRE
eukprot:scaffold31534_cov101-Isochrysis_galbana.AAC.1